MIQIINPEIRYKDQYEVRSMGIAYCPYNKKEYKFDFVNNMKSISKPSTWFHVFFLTDMVYRYKRFGKIDTGIDDNLYARNLTGEVDSPQWFFRIGSFQTNPDKTIRNFVQKGDYFYYG